MYSVVHLPWYVFRYVNLPWYVFCYTTYTLLWYVYGCDMVDLPWYVLRYAVVEHTLVCFRHALINLPWYVFRYAMVDFRTVDLSIFLLEVDTIEQSSFTNMLNWSLRFFSLKFRLTL